MENNDWLETLCYQWNASCSSKKATKIWDVTMLLRREFEINGIGEFQDSEGNQEALWDNILAFLGFWAKSYRSVVFWFYPSHDLLALGRSIHRLTNNTISFFIESISLRNQIHAILVCDATTTKPYYESQSTLSWATILTKYIVQKPSTSFMLTSPIYLIPWINRSLGNQVCAIVVCDATRESFIMLKQVQ